MLSITTSVFEQDLQSSKNRRISASRWGGRSLMSLKWRYSGSSAQTAMILSSFSPCSRNRACEAFRSLTNIETNSAENFLECSIQKWEFSSDPFLVNHGHEANRSCSKEAAWKNRLLHSSHTKEIIKVSGHNLVSPLNQAPIYIHIFEWCVARCGSTKNGHQKGNMWLKDELQMNTCSEIELI